MKRLQTHFHPIPLLLLALLCAPCFAAPGAPGVLDAPARTNVEEQYKARAAALLYAGKADEAYAAYRELMLHEPDDDTTLLGLARAASRDSAHWNQSVTAYEMLLDKYPEAAQLHVELAHVHMLVGERAAAEHHLAEARKLDGGEMADALDLDALQRRYDTLQIHGKLRAGLLYDSNVNMGPESDSLTLGNWRVNIPGAENKGSFGAYFGADLDFGWRPWRDAGWWLVGDLKGFWRGYENADLHTPLHASESQWGRAALGLRHVGGKTLLDVRFKTEIFDYEFLQSVLAMGPELHFVYSATDWLNLTTAAGWDSRIYSDSPTRNGGYAWAGEYLTFFFGESRHELTIGARALWGRANLDRLSYEGFEASARLNFKLPYRVEISPFASLAQEFYHGPATALEIDNRWDSRWRVGVSAHWHFTERWSLEATYMYSDNWSSSPLYDYDQHLVSMGVAWEF